MAAILVVDDQPAVLALIRISLESAGHHVVAVDDSRAVSGLLKKQTLDLLITDIFMPDQDGIELIQAVRKEFPTVAIIAMSGVSLERREYYLEAGRTFGADAILGKPFGGKELFASIEEALGKAALRKPN